MKLRDADRPMLTTGNPRQANNVAGLALSASFGAKFGHGRDGGPKSRASGTPFVPPYMPVVLVCVA